MSTLVPCPACQHQVSTGAAACPSCGHQLAAQSVQATQGATGKFLDPGANARSCLGCVAAILILGIAAVVFGMLAN